MEQSLNKVELKGVVGRISIIEFAGVRKASISLATNYGYRNRDGECVIETTWHIVNAWEGHNIDCFDSITKGTKLHVLGRIRNHKVLDANGGERFISEVIASTVEIVDEEQLTFETN